MCLYMCLYVFQKWMIKCKNFKIIVTSVHINRPLKTPFFDINKSVKTLLLTLTNCWLNEFENFLIFYWSHQHVPCQIVWVFCLSAYLSYFFFFLVHQFFFCHAVILNCYLLSHPSFQSHILKSVLLSYSFCSHDCYHLIPAFWVWTVLKFKQMTSFIVLNVTSFCNQHTLVYHLHIRGSTSQNLSGN